MFAYESHSENNSYPVENYPYPTPERPHLYPLQSLEQIASEVLEMNPDYQDQPEMHHTSKEVENARMLHGLPSLPIDSPDADESVDSGVSLPEHNGTHQKEEVVDMTKAQSAALAAYHTLDRDDVKTAPPSVVATVGSDVALAAQRLPNANHSTNNLPLYKPPAPLSQSPEQSRRVPNGDINEMPSQSTDHKRKRSSMSESNGSKHVRPNAPGLEVEDQRSERELAQVMQQQNAVGVQSS